MSDIEEDETEVWSDEEDQILCLFCNSKFPSQEAFLEHARDAHQFDFLGTKRTLGLDFYGCIRLINFIRSEARTKTAAVILEGLAKAPFMDDEKYMKPVIADDALLFADWGDESSDEEDNKTPPAKTTDIKELAFENEMLRKRLAEAHQAMARMSKVILGETSLASRSSANSEKKVALNSKELAKEIDRRTETEIDQDYFGSYSGREIHELMLRDTARTEAYRDSMYKNKDYFRDKVVLDIGCGTGILSMFAARAGARKVIGIDMAGIIVKAREIVEANGLSDKITLIRSKVEEAVLPVEQVDIIISEWMGYFLLYESMLPSVLFARDKWLAPGGRVFPNLATMFLAGAEADERNQKAEGFWNNVYGFDMRCLIKAHEKHKGSDSDVIDIKTLITDQVELQHFNIMTVQDAQLDFKAEFRLTATRTHKLHLFVVWFDTLFNLVEHKGWTSVNLSTGPKGPLPPNECTDDQKDRIGTHWKQSLFWLEHPVDLKVGDHVTGTLTATRREQNRRAYNVSISYQHVPCSSAEEPSQRYVQGYTIE